MAKMGEGDKRWLVEERADGANVNSWHWAEKDVLQWAKRRLTELLGSVTLTQEGGFLLQTTGVTSVTGEAFVNNRKRKLIPSYELTVQGSWQGRSNSGATAEGTFSLPYIADENADEDPELKVSTPSEDASLQRAKQIFLANKEVLLAQVRIFVSEIRKGGPVSSSSGQGGDAPPEASASKPGKPAFSAEPKAKAAEPPAGPSGGKRTLKMKERFHARREDLYECFTDTRKLQAFTRGPAVAEPKVGGVFNIFGGAVQGNFTALKPPDTLSLSWRFANWPDGTTSKVTLKFEEPEAGSTVVHLTHAGIPEEDRFGNADVVNTTKQGWQERIFHSIRAVFGYGL